MLVQLLILFLVSHGVFRNDYMAQALPDSNGTNASSLDSIREDLIRLEDTIIFSLIERAKFPLNSPAYDQSYAKIPGFTGSLVQFVAKETEATQAKAGRFTNPEENPFFPDGLPPSVVPPQNHTEALHPPASSVNINKSIWSMYFDKLLALFVAPGDDGNYAATAASDLVCLQALSRRIHYGKLVAEAKFKESPQKYVPLIRDKNTQAIMNLLTVPKVEEEVKLRVARKATVFGQNVTLNGTDGGTGNNKVDPSVVSRLYGEWVIPLTKQVEVDYLLRRLD